MRSLYWRVWLTVVAALALFALASWALVQRQFDQQRGRFEAIASERTAAWGELIQRSLPGPDAPRAEQAAALDEWAERLRLPLALDAADGTRIAQSDEFRRRAREHMEHAPGAPVRMFAVPLDDGRTLHVLRAPRMLSSRGGDRGPPPRAWAWAWPAGWIGGPGLVLMLALLFAAVAAGAFPVVRRLTRRLEALQSGVERFGAGALDQRVDASGQDEVARVAASFNQAAERIERLVQSHQSLLANASHELRSPLARLKMALAMLDSASPERRAALQHEIDTNIRELDALVDEVLLASRLDAREATIAKDPVDLLALATEEAARVRAQVDTHAAHSLPAGAAAKAWTVLGDERLLRRALRNLLENARRYGDGGEITVTLAPGSTITQVHVCDRGPGVPEAMRERIFEPFFRLPGHAERAGGIGLGLSLVRQIAERHGGAVRCQAREGGGSCFVLSVPTTRT